MIPHNNVSFKYPKNQGCHYCRKDRSCEDIYPDRQGGGGLFPFGETGLPCVFGRSAVRIAADRAAGLKQSFSAAKTTGRAEDRCKIPPAFGTIMCVSGYFGSTALAEKTRGFGAAS